jgi:RecA/RadA recombinase
MEKETAAEVFGRLKFPDQNDFQLSFLSELQPGKVLELLGEPSSGKSQVLMTAVAECVMHPDARAVFIDLDDKLSLLRLVDVIESHVRYSTECSEEQMSATALEQVRNTIACSII